MAAVIGATALPAHSPYFDVLIIADGLAIVVGLIGLLVIWFTVSKEDTPAPPNKMPAPSSTFIKSMGGSIIEIEDSYSSADTFADVQDSKLSARRNRHEPGLTGGVKRLTSQNDEFSGCQITNCTIVNCGTGVLVAGGSVQIDGLDVINTPNAIVVSNGATVRARRVNHQP